MKKRPDVFGSEYRMKQQGTVCVYAFDMDGTLSLPLDRSPYDHSLCHNDPPHLPVVHLAHSLIAAGEKLIIISARPEEARDQTRSWLERHEVTHEALFMRKSGDNRFDGLVKSEIYHRDIAPVFHIKMVFDDRQRVVDVWRTLGVPCSQVAPGDF